MSLSVDIDHYKSIFLPDLLDMEKFFYAMTLNDAIVNAATGTMRSGKMNSHQRRVGKSNGSVGAKELLKHENEIRKSKNFEEIFQITEKVKKEIYGLGALWSYDTALRIGFNLKLYPKDVYVQAGVVKGVKKALAGKNWHGRSLALSIFPKEIQKLKPYQAENFLCIWGKKKDMVSC